jgi:hypothetical protein
MMVLGGASMIIDATCPVALVTIGGISLLIELNSSKGKSNEMTKEIIR